MVHSGFTNFTPACGRIKTRSRKLWIMTIWPLQSECAARFGNPSTASWQRQNLIQIPVPWKLAMGNIPIRAIPINKIAAPSLAKVLADIWQQCGKSQKAIAHIGMDQFSGSFAVRKMRGGNEVSMHSYGLAIDWDAPKNPQHAPDAKTEFHSHSTMVKAFKAEGWIVGVDWSGNSRDAMHVQAARVKP